MATPSYITPATRFDNQGQAEGYMDWLRNNSQQVSPFGSQVDPNNPMGSLAADYKSQMDLANKKNEDRYGEILKGYRDRRIRALDTAQGLGAQETKDISSRFNTLRGNTQQDLVSRGLTGTTVLPSMMSGIARQESDAQGALNERLKREQIGLDTGLDQDTLQFMERKNEVGPDFNMLARLMQGAGAGAGGGGMMMGGGGREKNEEEERKRRGVPPPGIGRDQPEQPREGNRDRLFQDFLKKGGNPQDFAKYEYENRYRSQGGSPAGIGDFGGNPQGQYGDLSAYYNQSSPLHGITSLGARRTPRPTSFNDDGSNTTTVSFGVGS